MARRYAPAVIIWSFSMRFPPAALAAVLAAPLAIAATPVPSPDLAAVQAHLRGVQTMTADFSQTDARGRVLTGTIQLKKPGKVRFQYRQGVPLLVVGDGKALTMIDYSVKQVSRWPIGNTPLALLLDPDKDVTRYAKIVPSGSPDTVMLAGQDPKHREYGSITVAFRRSAGAPGGLVLDGWTVLDAQNNRTTVRLTNQRFNVGVDDSAFRWTDPRPQGPRH
jgi:outer membrane lipoprotein-sorting protein